MKPLAGKRAVVTGGARGLGAQVALDLADRGASVAIWDGPAWPDAPLDYTLSGREELDSTLAELLKAGQLTIAINVDVRHQDAVSLAAERTVMELGGVDILIVAAGVRTIAEAKDMSDAEWDAVIDTNLHGAFHAIRACLPHLESSDAGRVVLISAEEGRRGARAMSHYSAAAWGLIGLAKSIAVEEAPYGVAVTVVCPGPIETPMATPSANRVMHRPTLAGTSVSLEAVADMVCFAAKQPGLELTGSVLDVTGGLVAYNAS